MRRIVLVILLWTLPFQFTWAAAAGYCTHEQDSGSAHFAHHEHQHDAAAGSMPSGADPDCGMCHLGCGQLPAAETPVVLIVQSGTLSAGPQPCMASDLPASIERPKWRRAA